MKKILFVMTDLMGGGAEKALIEFLKNFDYTRSQVTLCLLFNRGVYLKDLPKEVKLITLFDDPENRYYDFAIRFFRKLNISSFLSIYMTLKLKRRYDTVISFMEGTPAALHSMLFKKGRQHISWVHIDIYKNKCNCFPSHQKEEDTYNRLDYVVCVANDTKKAFLKTFDVPEKKVKVLYNLIDRAAITQHSSDFQVVKRKFTIGLVGTLGSRKRPDSLIRVARLFKEAGYDLDFWFVGGPGYLEEMSTLSHENGVDDCCVFWGFQKNPYPYMKAMDIYVSTSYVEGFSLTVAEAFCLGRPVVATRTCGPVELLDEGHFGLLTDFDDQSIFEALKSLVDDSSLREQYAEKALERSRMFDVDRTMRELYVLLDGAETHKNNQ